MSLATIAARTAAREAKDIRPQKGPQEDFLASAADIVIYGGAAGGGKSFGLLLTPLYHTTNPDFGAVIFRKDSPQIRAKGGLWDESVKLYPYLGARPRETNLEWVFPSGASVKFAHLQYESSVYDYQGSQIPLIGFDELTHFSEAMFFYMMSRNRSSCGVRPHIRATTNPDADSWVAGFISWWIDQDTGYAIPERSGVLRYVQRIDDQLVWGDTPEEVALRTGHPDLPVKSVTFIPATLEDNPALTAADPGYMASLMALPLVERERLLGANWKIRPAAGKVFNRAWFTALPAADIPRGGQTVRFWDFAATAKQQKGKQPDFTAGVLLRRVRHRFGTEAKPRPRYFILDVVAVQKDPEQVEDLVLRTARADRRRCLDEGSDYTVAFEQEPSDAGKRDARNWIQLLDGYTVRKLSARGDKLVKSRAFASQAAGDNVYLEEGPWNETFLAHMHAIPDGPKDDIHDAAAGAYNTYVHRGGLFTEDDLAVA